MPIICSLNQLIVQATNYWSRLHKYLPTFKIPSNSPSLSGVPNPSSVDWYKGIQKLEETGPELKIDSVEKNDKGDYYCVARNDYGQIYSPAVSLQVQYLDSNFDAITCFKEFTKDGELTMIACSETDLNEGICFDKGAVSILASEYEGVTVTPMEYFIKEHNYSR